MRFTESRDAVMRVTVQVRHRVTLRQMAAAVAWADEGLPTSRAQVETMVREAYTRVGTMGVDDWAAPADIADRVSELFPEAQSKDGDA